jgi:YrbI family 3-deoxy-D-manno-octulosonate 8-phosphate phosphatase
MSTVAIIPARGGSKGITDKNLQPVHGVPLVVRAIRAATMASSIDAVYVSTDSERIAAVSRSNGAEVITRPDDISGDTASSESAILHAIDNIPGVDTVVFIQATSPFIDPSDIDKACDMVNSAQYDMVLSGTEDHGFRWELRDGSFRPIGHEASSRPRRQDLPHRILETGAFYVFKAKGIKEAGSRFHGRIGVVEVSKRDALEIDTLDDLQMARELALDSEPSGALSHIEAVVFDFDGVHTDDHVYLTQEGVESVRLKRGDGMGISLLKKAGYPVLILSTEKNPVVTARAKKLGIDVLQGQDDKAAALEGWLKKKKIPASDVVYVGNDINDEGCLTLVGWPVVVADAHPSVRPLARMILTNKGGLGAVRELCDLVLNSRKA